VKRVLLTGMSGTGKSSVVEELVARGFKAVDMDYGSFCEVEPDGRQRRREDAIEELLATEDPRRGRVGRAAVARRDRSRGADDRAPGRGRGDDPASRRR